MCQRFYLLPTPINGTLTGAARTVLRNISNINFAGNYVLRATEATGTSLCSAAFIHLQSPNQRANS
jgi:hypothetical protein